MTTIPPLPPYILHHSTPLTHAQAHTHLSTFLLSAQNDPAYRPDSVLTDRGPQSASTSGSNLVLAHLDRIRRGMAGERIGGTGGDAGMEVGMGVGVSQGRGRKRKFDEDEEATQQGGEEYGDGYAEGEQDDGTVIKTVEEETDEGHGREVALQISAGRDDWMDKDDYDLAQEDGEGGDEGFRADETQPGAVDISEQPGSPEEARAQMKVRTGKSDKDKAARKAAKKDRNKELKREREAAKIAR